MDPRITETVARGEHIKIVSEVFKSLYFEDVHTAILQHYSLQTRSLGARQRQHVMMLGWFTLA